MVRAMELKLGRKLSNDEISHAVHQSRVKKIKGISTADVRDRQLAQLADDERSHLLPYAQFLHAEMTSNPALERNADEPPEQLLICFAAARVTVIGSGLKSLERAIQRLELKFVKSADRRYVAALKTHVASVAIHFTKENQ
jgi:hypothetical protein